MTKWKIILFSAILLSALICNVSAQNITDNTLNTTIDYESVSAGDDYSFTSLKNEISHAKEEYNISHDYTFSVRDDIEGINITKNITINGNNHILDAKHLSRIFNINSSNIIITNLIVKNAASSAIRIQNSNLTTINVTFLNNTLTNNGGALIASNTHYTSINDTFIDNKAKYGSAIALFDGSVLELKNGNFKSSITLDWGLITMKYSTLTLTDTTFSNLNSSYATALYLEECKGLIKNSKFINLFANKTGGSVALIHHQETFNIENCSFINSSSRKNGGAIYCEGNINSKGIVNLKDSNFINCSSAFGGACLQLNGDLSIERCSFNHDNSALYTSGVNCRITETSFEDNSQDCIHFDNGILKVTNSRFKDNNQLYIYDSQYMISSCEFINNPIFTGFDRKNSFLTGNSYANSKPTINDMKYIDMFENTLTSIDFKAVNIPSSVLKNKQFDLRDYDIISPVKNQGNKNSCWAFAASSVMESALLKIGINIDISENNLFNLASKYSPYGDKDTSDGSSYDVALSYFLSGLGPVSEVDDDYDELGKISQKYNNPFYSLDLIEIEKGIGNIKKGLTAYGALYISIHGPDDLNYYDEDANSAYYPIDDGNSNHAASIIGWDDTYSRDNFKVKPENDGAWIVKNSWGTEWGDEGYYYISYYDKLLYSPYILGITVNPIIYNRIYQQDMASQYYFYDPDANDYIKYAASYISKGNDLISAVGSYFYHEGAKYTINVYINGNLAYSQKGLSKVGGFETIKLTSQISVTRNDKFTIEITANEMPYSINGRQKSDHDYSYYIINTKKYNFPEGISPIIKAYTLPNPISTKNIVQYYSSSKTTYTISNIKEKTVTVKIDNKQYKLTVKNNRATVKIKLNSGKHVVTTYYNGKKIINLIIVKPTIKSDKEIKIGYHAKKTIKIKYLDKNGNILKNKAVKVKFNGKTIKGKTDKKGFFKVKISNKLKIGKYTIKCTNPKTGEQVKITVKILSRFKSHKNMKMYYYDGSKYKVRIIADNGKYSTKGKVIKIKIDKKTFKAKTDKKGWVKFKIPSKIMPGKHKIKLTYKSQSIKHKLTVKKILKVNVKKTSQKIILKATLKKKLKNKVIKFKFNKKTFKAKTNRKGVAQVIIKKYMKGKTYPVKISYYKTSKKARIKT